MKWYMNDESGAEGGVTGMIATGRRGRAPAIRAQIAVENAEQGTLADQSKPTWLEETRKGPLEAKALTDAGLGSKKASNG